MNLTPEDFLAKLNELARTRERPYFVQARKDVANGLITSPAIRKATTALMFADYDAKGRPLPYALKNL